MSGYISHVGLMGLSVYMQLAAISPHKLCPADILALCINN